MKPKKARRSRIRELQEEVAFYKLVFDNIHSGAVITDAEGNITHFNTPYARFLGIDPQAQIGRHCTEVMEDSRMHIVARTGMAEINQTHRIKGQDMVVQRIPIKKKGEVVAVFGQIMYQDVRDAAKLAGRLAELEARVAMYEEELIHLGNTRYTFDHIIGESPEMRQLKKEALRVVDNRFPILITGERGTGKELLARAIHHAGSRRAFPFVRIDCARIPPDILESDLLGHDEGAGEGVGRETRPGKFEMASGGTVFLDEIGRLPLEMQPKLLRVLEEQEFEHVGGSAPTRIDFRLIAATSQNLESMMVRRRFRKDLYYRLNVIYLRVPPLRERREDVVPIAEHLLEQLKERSFFPKVHLSRAARRILSAYDWPGNVRELYNVLERAVGTLESDTIRPSDLPYYIQQGRQTRRTGPGTIRAVQARAEKEAIVRALEKSDYNKSRAAEMLGIHRTLLYKKLKKYGLPLKSPHRSGL